MIWLRLIRWKNLLIIFFTQLLVWWSVMLPLHRGEAGAGVLNLPDFLLLAISTMLIAAAGYIINDYFDIKIDTINRPEKMVLEKTIPRRAAIILHTLLNIIALLLAGLVAARTGNYEWLTVQLICTILLWFYSTTFKRQFMTGNVVVALLTALTIIVLIIYDPAMHGYMLRPPFLRMDKDQVLPNPIWLLGFYTYFAFVLTWMREIVKDMEDYKGDAEEGCVTMPIQWGLERSAWFTQGLGLLAVVPLAVVAVRLLAKGEYVLGVYTIAALILPILLWMGNINKKATTEHYGKASRWLKLIMLLGIGSLIIYYFEAHA